LLSCLEEALPASPAPTHPSGWLPTVRSRSPLLLTLLLLGVVGLRRTRDLRGYTGAALGLLTGRKRAYGYFHTERVLTSIAKAGGADQLTTALGKWTASLWPSASPISSPCFYIDGHRKPVYADKLIPRGLIGNNGKVLGARALVLLHDEQGHPLLVTTHRGDQHLTVGLPPILTRYEASGAVVDQSRLIVDREGMAACFLRDLTLAGYTVVTVLKTDQYTGIESFTEVGTFVPLKYDRDGQVVREVAEAGFALPLPESSGQTLPLRVALIRDWRRQIIMPEEEEAQDERNAHKRGWWRDGWKAQPTPAPPTQAKLIPIVTTALTCDAVELGYGESHTSVLCSLFPKKRARFFEELTVLWASLVWLPFDALKRHIPIRVNGVNLFDVPSLDAHYISFVQALQPLIDLILDTSLFFAWQRVVVPSGSARAKRHNVEVLSVIGHQLACLVGRQTKGISIMLFGQIPGFAQGGRLVAKERGQRCRCAKGGI
jgi:hypothetical protein